MHSLARFFLVALLFSAGRLRAQTINCSIPTVVSSQILQRINFTPFGWTCEAVTQDPTTAFSRDASGLLHISAVAGTPGVAYTVAFQAEYKTSNTTEPAAAAGATYNGIPASVFDGQTVWCINKAQNAGASVITPNQIATILPVALIEVRQGTGSSKITSSNIAWPPPTRWKWNPSHSICAGAPGITFAKDSDLMYQDSNTTASAPLLQMYVLSLVPAQ